MFGDYGRNVYFCNAEKQYRLEMKFLKEKYWNSMGDDVLTMSGDIVVTSLEL